MQTTIQPEIAKRARLYQAHIDINQLKRGQYYDLLKPCYVIFICKFDPFGDKRYRYTFLNTCQEQKNLELGDESYKVFFNTMGSKGEIPTRLQELLCYMNDTQAYPVEETDNPLIHKIEKEVSMAKMDEDWRRSYMTYAIHQRDAELRGIAIGEKRGIVMGVENNKTATAQKLLCRGMSVADVAEITELSAVTVQEIKASLIS